MRWNARSEVNEVEIYKGDEYISGRGCPQSKNVILGAQLR